MKKTNGITLIALVITIIVLLIIAGISISMLSGENSILGKSNQAKNQTDEKSLKEEAQIVVAGRITENITTGTNAKALEEELREKISNADEITTIIAGQVGACYVKKGNVELTVYDNGEVEEGKYEIWDGSTVECPEFRNENNVWNWYIYKPSQLKFLADFENDEIADGVHVPDNLKSIVSNAGYNADEITMSTDTTIYLMNNLDLGARQTNGTKTSGTDWTPIGVSVANVKNKLGIFEGNKHTIRGVYVNTTENYGGIFGNTNTIQNLTILNSYIKGGNCIGGIVGALRLGKIENCHNRNTTITFDSGNRVIGGIVGQIEGDVKNCSNTGKIIANGTSFSDWICAGGIIGNIVSEATIQDCNNSGSVFGYGKAVGGIVGYTNDVRSSKIERCINSGKIEGKGAHTGGIVGYGNGEIKLCINTGNIYSNNQVGGIIGSLEVNSSVSECSNSGMVEGKYGYAAGIVGSLQRDESKKSNSLVEKCYNNGKIEGPIKTGGIVGVIFGSTATVIECYNKGMIKNVEEYGEIIGNINITTNQTFNKLFYLTNNRRLNAIGGQDDDELKLIKDVPDDLTYERFKTWITEQVLPTE